MALVPMKDLLFEAERGNYAVGAFSVADMEMILGAVRAAEEMNSPLILQVAEVRLKYSPLKIIAPMMLAAAKNASVPIAVHLDHGRTTECIQEALQLGFTSVMIDASDCPIEENIRRTKQIRTLADRYGATVEAEVGQIGVSEDGTREGSGSYSDPWEVKRLKEEAGVDAIALSIGNAHGLYQAEPRLNFEILRKSRELTGMPLVLHGGTGIGEEDFKCCIRGGIRKINVATATFLAVERAAREYAKEDRRDYFRLSAYMTELAYENVKRHIGIFGSEGNGD